MTNIIFSIFIFAFYTSTASASTALFSAESNCKKRSLDGLYNRCTASSIDFALSKTAPIPANASGILNFTTEMTLAMACDFQSPKITVNGNVIDAGGKSVSGVKKFSIERKAGIDSFLIQVQPSSLSDVVKPGCIISIEREVTLPNLAPLKEYIEGASQDLTMVELALSALTVAESNTGSKAILILAKTSLDASLTSFEIVAKDLEAKAIAATEADARGEIEAQIAEMTGTVNSIKNSLAEIAGCATEPTCAPDFAPAKSELQKRKERARSTLQSIKAFLETEDTRLIDIEDKIRLQIKDLLAMPGIKEIAS